MTRDEAIQELCRSWHGCHDAAGLLNALERMGAVKFDETEDQALIKRARETVLAANAIIPVNITSVSMLSDLVLNLVRALERRA